MAATEAGVTILGTGGPTSLAGRGGVAFSTTGADGGAAFGLAALASAAAVTGGFTTVRAGGFSAASFCCCILRSTSPGREMFERSILVLMPSSLCDARELLDELVAPSERPRRCFRTRSASWSSRELECVFFSVTPTAVRESRISLLLTSNSRAKSLIRILLIRSSSSSCPAHVVSLSAHIEPHEIPVPWQWRAERHRSAKNGHRTASVLFIFRGFFSGNLYRRARFGWLGNLPG